LTIHYSIIYTVHWIRSFSTWYKSLPSAFYSTMINILHGLNKRAS